MKIVFVSRMTWKTRPVLTGQIPPAATTLYTAATQVYNESYAEEQLHKFCDFFLCVQYDSDLGDMTLSQGHDRSLGHGQQMSEVSFKSKLPVKSYDANTEFRYVCTVTLNLEL